MTEPASTKMRNILFGVTGIVSIALDQWPLPIALFGGVAHHFISYKVIEGYEPYMTTPFGTGASNTFEFGVRVYAAIANTVQLRAEGEQYVDLGDGDYRWKQTERRAYKLGVAYLF